jgi:hypothetical protein
MGILLTNYRNGTPSVSSLSGVAASQIGGPLRRETAEGNGSGTEFRSESNRSIQFQGTVYVCHASTTTTFRVYKFDPDAYFSDITGLSGLFTLGETIVGQTSSATAIIADASISGDDFIIMKTITGTFQASETVVGQTSSASATITAAPTQGGSTGFGGEWIVQTTVSGTLKNTLSHSGIYAPGGKDSLFTLYVTSVNQCFSLIFSVGKNQWEQVGPLITFSDVGSATHAMARQKLIGDSLWSNIDLGGGTNQNFGSHLIYNPNTRNISQNTIAMYTGWNETDTGNSWDYCQYRGRIFTWRYPNNTTNSIELIEKSGVYWGSPFDPGSDAVSQEKPQITVANLRGGNLIYVLNDIMYAFYPASSGGWVCGRFHYDEGTNGISLVSSTMNSTGYSENERFSDFLMPSTLRTGLDFGQARWRSILDQETNDPDGTDKMILYHIGNPGGGVTSLYTHIGISDLSLVYTWNGTETVSVSNDPTTTDSLSVGDWIGLKNDQRVFRIASFATTTNPNDTITIVDSTSGAGGFSIGIPTGVSSVSNPCVKENPFVFVGSSGISESAFSESHQGLGHRSFVKGDLDIKTVGTEPNVTGTRVYFELYSTSGTETVNVEFFHGPLLKTADTTCTLSDASSGTINSVNQIVGLTANNGATTYQVTWVHASDGIGIHESRLLIPKVSL